MVEITGATRLYAIVGDPIAQAKSPAVYNAILAEGGADTVLVPWKLSAEDFETGMRGLMRAGNVDGIVLTFPHKLTGLAFADVVLPRARQVGSCNALRRTADGRWEADMFDGVGLVNAVAATGEGVHGKAAWLVGAGGAGSAIAFALAAAGVASLHISDVDDGKARRVAADVAAAAPGTRVAVGRPDLAPLSLLVHATPTGLADGDPFPIEGLDGLQASTLVVDIVPRETTPLLAFARDRGCRTVMGSAMVAGQARAVIAFFEGAP